MVATTFFSAALVAGAPTMTSVAANALSKLKDGIFVRDIVPTNEVTDRLKQTVVQSNISSLQQISGDSFTRRTLITNPEIAQKLAKMATAQEFKTGSGLRR